MGMMWVAVAGRRRLGERKCMEIIFWEKEDSMTHNKAVGTSQEER
jgi:hypothetical protein